ncbi:MAG: hypothetical protein Q4G43_11595 [Mobilicoccus sp.]|nr:hypothetical protein [Mobilicoccus sp.]
MAYGQVSDTRPVLRATEALKLCEPIWRRELEAVNLAGEFRPNRDDARNVLRALERERHHGSLHRFPACVVVALVSTACEGYEGGNLWSAIHEALGGTSSQARQHAYGQAFLDALEQVGLPDLATSSRQKFARPMTVHACVPDYCIANFLTLLADRQDQDPDIDGPSFLTWATAPGLESRMSGLAVPVREFLRSGGEYAEDLCDRLLDLLEQLRAGERGLEALVGHSGASARMVRAAVALHDAGDLVFDDTRRRRDPSGASDTPASQLPRVLLDTDSGTLLLHLPPVGDPQQSRAWWQVSFDGDPRRVEQARSWGATRVPTTTPIDRPTRSIGVSLGTSDLRHDIGLVDAGLLAFDEGGALLPGTTMLPNGPVWLLHSRGTGGYEIAGEHRLLVEDLGPLGWHDWDLHLVDLGRARSVTVGGVSRPVRHASRARLARGAGTWHLLSADGSEVDRERPRVCLPRAGAEREWTVEVLDPQTKATHYRHEITVSAAGEPLEWPLTLDEDTGDAAFDPFHGWSEPVLGSFLIRARGPLGTRASWTVTIGEGITASTSVRFRGFVREGLTPVQVRLSLASPLLTLDGTSADLSLGADEPERPLTARTPSAALRLVCRPEHLAVRHMAPGTSAVWAISPVAIASDAPDELGTLDVRLPFDEALPALRLVAGGRTVQELPGRRSAAARRATHFRFDLHALSDTLRQHPSAELLWRVGEEDLVLARLRPRALATDARLVDGRIELADFAGVPAVRAGLYPVYAPWRDPIVVDVDPDGTFDCPEDLRDAGPLVVSLRIDDPWAPAPWSRWDGSGLRVDQGGVPTPEPPVGDGADAVSWYLAGLAPPPVDPDSGPYLWSAVALHGPLRRCGVRVNLLADIGGLFREHPDLAIATLTQASLDPQLALEFLIANKLTESIADITAAQAAALWTAHPVAAVLDASTTDRPLDAIVARCGPIAAALLRGEPDSEASTGCFDGAPMLARASADLIQQLLDDANVLPLGILDGSTRQVAAFELFQRKDDPRLTRAQLRRQQVVALAERVLADRPYLLHAIDQRLEKPVHHTWQRLPQLTLAFAGLARAAARDNLDARTVLDRYRDDWLALARVAPRMVTIDIVLAELLLIGATHPNTPPPQEDHQE